MRKTKDSGIEWIGKIPISWNVVPIRSTFKEIREKNILGNEKNALQFSYGTIIPKENFDSTREEYVAKTILNYSIVSPGTIIINGLNLNYDFISKRVGLVRQKGIITSAYIAFISKNFNYIQPEYACFLFKCYDSKKAFHNMGSGVRKILNYKELKLKKIIVPSLLNQERISKYLDFKCQQIDNLITCIEIQIDVLEKYKKSVITETVIKGLNKNVSMKDSGIEWIGTIPAHWLIRPLYMYFSERKNINVFGGIISLCESI